MNRFALTLTCVLAALKLFGLFTFSWLVVFAPVLISLVLGVALLAITGFIAMMLLS